MLAIEEAKLTKAKVKFINQELMKLIPGRTLEAIKGQRKMAAHKAKVIELLAEPEEPVEVPPEPTEVEDQWWTQFSDVTLHPDLLPIGPDAPGKCVAFILKHYPNAEKEERDSRRKERKKMSRKQIRRSMYAFAQKLFKKKKKDLLNILEQEN